MAALTLYFDRCFGSSLPEALRKAKPPFSVEYQGDSRGVFRFKQDTPDDVWLSAVGSKGWIVLSHDRKFHQIAAECAALKQHKVGCFYLWGSDAPTWKKLHCFMRAHEQIISVGQMAQRPFIFEVSQRGRLESVPIP